MKRLFFVLMLSFCLFLSGSLSTVSAESFTVGDEILKELKDVDLNAYQQANKTDVITLSEVGFGTDNYKLIVYVWNNSKEKLVKNSVSNVISMASSYNLTKLKPDEYSNFKLEYISSTPDDSIYKFRIQDPNNVIKTNANNFNSINKQRRYDIIGVQLFGLDDRLAIDYKVEKSYLYTGTNKSLSVDGVKSIGLDVHQAWFRTESSNVDVHHQHQLNSVYFSIPKDYLKDSYSLNKVTCEWYEYKTDAVVVVEDEDTKNKLYNYLGVNIGDYNNSLNVRLHYGGTHYCTNNSDVTNYEWTYNTWLGNSLGVRARTKTKNTSLHYVFNKSVNEKVSSKELTEYIYDYKASSIKGYLPIKNGQVSADLFLDTVDTGRTRGYNCVTISAEDEYDLLNYESTHSTWDKIVDAGSLWNYWFGDDIPSGSPNYENIKAIQQVTDDDVGKLDDISTNLLIDQSLVTDFKVFYNDSKKEERVTYMFRFAVTDYEVHKFGSSQVPCFVDGYVAWETVFLDFDIIYLEFTNGRENLVVPVVSSPIDHVADVTPPPLYDNKWIWWMIGVILACVVGIVFYNLYEGEVK